MKRDNEGWADRAEQAAAVLREWAADVDEKGRWPEEGVAALAGSGLMGLTVPAEFGGAGLGPRAFNAVLQTLAAACPSTAMIYLMHVCGTQVIASAEAFARREEVLRAIAGGRHLTTLAFSEKGSRSHFWSPVSRAVADGGHHLLSASKSWVTSAGRADSYVVSTGAAGSDNPVSSTLYWVAWGTPGLAVSGPWNGMGLRGNASAPMTLDSVRVDAGSVVSPEGKGFDVMLGVVLPYFLLGTAAVNLGIASAAAEATRRHLMDSRFQHLDQPLASLPNLRARLARMRTLVDTHRAFLNEVVSRMEGGDPGAMLAVLEAKAALAEAVLEVTDLAMRACGGAAFSRHLAVERMFRDARAGWVMAPTTDVLNDFIGKSLLDIPLF